jgi:hypothetical protein
VKPDRTFSAYRAPLTPTIELEVDDGVDARRPDVGIRNEVNVWIEIRREWERLTRIKGVDLSWRASVLAVDQVAAVAPLEQLSGKTSSTPQKIPGR